jgi:hypothetical protein
MAAQPKPIPLRPSDVDGELDRRPASRHDVEDRRRMNVSEKLAEGRGFWRGAFVGAAIGAAGGMVSSVGVADMWTDQVLKTVMNSATVAQVLAGVDGAHAVQTVHPETPNELPVIPGGSSDSTR